MEELHVEEFDFGRAVDLLSSVLERVKLVLDSRGASLEAKGSVYEYRHSSWSMKSWRRDLFASSS